MELRCDPNEINYKVAVRETISESGVTVHNNNNNNMITSQSTNQPTTAK